MKLSFYILIFSLMVTPKTNSLVIDFITQTNSVLQSEILIVFNDIEKGINSGNVSAISKYFSTETFLSLNNGIMGYYSANQSYYVLQSYFNTNRPISFKYSIVASENNPYATGTLTYDSRNKRETAQVFISLDKFDKSWKISQITIK
ncbi:MAG TPA: DUF4783 domain-containing protein [Ignavibacteriaceae bacterium]|nr:DUF4783 domain-containing protein [Ignavibacteriaceae bacterium]